MQEAAGSIDERILSAMTAVKNVAAESVTMDSSLDELGFDSLDRITLLFELEKAYQVSIPDEAARSIRSVGDIAEGLEKLIDAQSAERGDG